MSEEILRGRHGIDVICEGVIASRGWSVGHVKSRPLDNCQKSRKRDSVPTHRTARRSCTGSVIQQWSEDSRPTQIAKGRQKRSKHGSLRHEVRALLPKDRLVEDRPRETEATPETARSLSRDTLVEVTLNQVADGGSIPPGSTSILREGGKVR